MATKEQIIDSLEKQIVNIANANLLLASQGYNVSNNKRLQLSIIMIDLYDNFDLLNVRQKNNTHNLYNTILTL